MKIKADLHVHTIASDGINTIKELVAGAKARGLDAIAVCDHNMCTPLPSSDIMLIPATEISTDCGHIVGLFVTNINFDTLRKNGLPSASAAVHAIHAAGGLAVLAHPFERKNFKKDVLDKVDFDFIEASNSRAVMKLRDANNKASRYAEERGIPVVGGSDAHSVSELGGSYTEIELSNPSDIRASVQNGKTRAVFLRQCSWITKAKTRLFVCWKQRNPQKILKACIYLCYAAIRDLMRILHL